MALSVENISSYNSVERFRLDGTTLYSIQRGGPMGRIVIFKGATTLIWNGDYKKQINCGGHTIFINHKDTSIATNIDDVMVDETEIAGGYILTLSTSEWSVWAETRKSYIYNIGKNEWLRSRISQIPYYTIDDYVDWDIIYAFQEEFQNRFKY